MDDPVRSAELGRTKPYDENLLPEIEMSPFGPDIPRRCAAVMDNASIHHVAQVQQLFVDVGVLLIFQPPYSQISMSRSSALLLLNATWQTHA